MTKILAALMTCLLTLACFSVEAQIVYRWIDKEGTVHYGEHPPENGEYEKIDSHIYNRPGVTFYRRGDNPQKQQDAAPTNEEIENINLAQAKVLCSNAQYDLDVMQSYRKLREKKEDGTLVVISEDERQNRIAQAKQRIDKFCLK